MRNFRFNNLFFIFLLSLGCAEKKPDEPIVSEEGVSYAFYQDGVAREWGSKELALNKAGYHGIVEVSKYVGIPQTPEQKAGADKLYADTLEAVLEKKWYELENAFRDGYIYDAGRDPIHYPNYEFIFDDEHLNPKKPEYLMVYKTPIGPVLAGVMYLMGDLESHGPQVGGAETVWHFHDYEGGYCETFPIPEGHVLHKKLKKGDCKKGYLVNRSAEMLHVWFVDRPEGRFASSMSVPLEFLESGNTKLLNFKPGAQSEKQI